MNGMPLALATVHHYNPPGGHAIFDGHTTESAALGHWYRRRPWGRAWDARDGKSASIERLSPDAAAQMRRRGIGFGRVVHSRPLLVIAGGEFWADPGLEERNPEDFGRLARAMARDGIRRVAAMRVPWGERMLGGAAAAAPELPGQRSAAPPPVPVYPPGHEPDL